MGEKQDPSCKFVRHEDYGPVLVRFQTLAQVVVVFLAALGVYGRAGAAADNQAAVFPLTSDRCLPVISTDSAVLRRWRLNRTR